jgi:hypothetical protein
VILFSKDNLLLEFLYRYIPLSVPQSSRLVIISCATSQSFLVKYPDSEVLSAVSAKPFLVPLDATKYSKVFSRRSNSGGA